MEVYDRHIEPAERTLARVKVVDDFGYGNQEGGVRRIDLKVAVRGVRG